MYFHILTHYTMSPFNDLLKRRSERDLLETLSKGWEIQITFLPTPRIKAAMDQHSES